MVANDGGPSSLDQRAAHTPIETERQGILKKRADPRTGLCFGWQAASRHGHSIGRYFWRRWRIHHRDQSAYRVLHAVRGRWPLQRLENGLYAGILGLAQAQHMPLHQFGIGGSRLQFEVLRHVFASGFEIAFGLEDP